MQFGKNPNLLTMVSIWFVKYEEFFYTIALSVMSIFARVNI